MRTITFLLVGLLAGPGTTYATALDDYVRRPDPNTAWRLVDDDDGLVADTYLLHLTSQQWRSAAEVDRPLWRHELIVADPSFELCGDNNSRETAILLINGGRNPLDDRLDGDDARLAQLFASTFCSVVAILNQVPNQPLNFTDEPRRPRTEDAIIVYSFDKFLTTGDPEWPVQLAMTKAATAAMTAVQEFSRSGRGVQDVNDFIVVGGSKRGWTAWLAAAVDPRVKALLPLSIDMLNLGTQFSHHWQAYGFYAPAVYDYLEYDIGCRLQSNAGRALLDIVDPYSYRDRYTMPKLLVNSAGDQFFVSDSSRFYYDQLPAPKWLRYTANTDHAQGDTDDVLSLILAARSWIDDVNDGVEPPRYRWEFLPDGAIRVETFDSVDRVRVWQADSLSRDFRLEALGPAWRSTGLNAVEDGVYVARIESPAPAQGYRAFFVEIEFDEGALLEADQVYTSGVRVLPDTLPFAGTDCRAFPSYSNLWWNPRQSGQALQILQQGERIGGAWYLYDQAGDSFWVNFIATLTDGRTARGQLLRFQGPPPGGVFDSDRVSSTPVGNAVLRFRSSHSASLSYTLNGVPGLLQLVPFERLADPDLSDIWYDPLQSGQGVQLVRRDTRLAGAWYLYDDSGRADWLTFQGLLQGNRLQAELWRFRGPALGSEWDSDELQHNAVGRVDIELPENTPSSGPLRFDYRVGGASGMLDLVPFRF